MPQTWRREWGRSDHRTTVGRTTDEGPPPRCYTGTVRGPHSSRPLTPATGRWTPSLEWCCRGCWLRPAPSIRPGSRRGRGASEPPSWRDVLAGPRPSSAAGGDHPLASGSGGRGRLEDRMTAEDSLGMSRGWWVEGAGGERGGRMTSSADRSTRRDRREGRMTSAGSRRSMT